MDIEMFTGSKFPFIYRYKKDEKTVHSYATDGVLAIRTESDLQDTPDFLFGENLELCRTIDEMINAVATGYKTTLPIKDLLFELIKLFGNKTVVRFRTENNDYIISAKRLKAVLCHAAKKGLEYIIMIPGKPITFYVGNDVLLVMTMKQSILETHKVIDWQC